MSVCALVLIGNTLNPPFYQLFFLFFVCNFVTFRVAVVLIVLGSLMKHTLYLVSIYLTL